jgi:Zn finger protein HypA/HybF involved in hydrogenase expression
VHEMSVAMEVCRIARDQVGFEALASVREIGMVVGHHSGVEPSSLRFCLETLLEQPPFSGARAVFQMTPGDDLRVDYLEVDDGGSAD